jgi:uncharacterized membrane protein YhaH (DUF805 family)
MDMSLFTSFEGRISRSKWWLGTIVMTVVTIVVAIIVYALMGASIMGTLESGLTLEMVSSVARKVSIAQLLTLVIVAYPVTALMVKRLNDRDRPNYLPYVFWLPAVLTILAGLAGLTWTVVDVGGTLVASQSGIATALSLLSLVIGIWALIELGILKGTSGPNQHGPDPLGGV